MLNIANNYCFMIGSQNFVLNDVLVIEPPPRVPFASFGFQNAVVFTCRNAIIHAKRRAEFLR